MTLRVGGSTYANRPISSFSSTQIVINPIFTTTAATWTVQVINPDGQASNEYSFNVSSPEKGNLTITVRNINGSSTPIPGAYGSVELYNSSNQLVSSQGTSSSGVATFTNITPGSGYWYKVFHKTTQTIFGTEYWGQKSGINLVSGTMTNEIFTRNMPYCVSVRAYNNSTNQDITGGNITLGTAVRIELTIQNPSSTGSATQSIKGRLVLDRDKTSGNDFDEMSASSQTVGVGSSVKFTFSYTPQNAGTYYYAPGSLTNVGGTDLYTDGWGWSSLALFTAGDLTPPIVLSTSPKNGDLAAPVTSIITATFSKDIQAGTMPVRVVDTTNVSIAIKTVSIVGRTLNISLVSPLVNGTGYAVEISAGAVKDLSGNPNPLYSWAFVTARVDAPDKPNLVSPLDYSTGIPTTVTLYWSPVSRATGYVVQMAKDVAFSEKVFDKAVGGISVQVDVPPSTQYFWRVLAAVNQTIGPWSDVWRFTTTGVSASKLNLSIDPTTTQFLDRGQSVEYTATVMNDLGHPVADARIVGQDEILSKSFDIGTTAIDGTIKYRFGSVPLNATDGTVYNITFRAVKSGFSDSQILSRKVQVRLPTLLKPYISVNQTSYSFVAQHNGSLPAAQSLIITNTGSGTLNWSISGKPSWLDVTPTFGDNNNATVQIRPNTTSLNPLQSPYSATLQVTSTNASNTPKTIAVMFEIQTTATQLSVGGVTIYANSITDVSSGVKRATGNVTINRILNFSGSIDIRTSDLTVTGDCEIYIDNVPRVGKVTLYDGQFNFEVLGQEGRLTRLTDFFARRYFRMAGFKVKVTEITLLSDGVRIKGGIDFKSQFGVEVGVSTLEVTKSSGLRIAGGISINKVTLSNAIQLENLVIQFDQFEDRFEGSAFIKTPAIGVGGGFGMLGGKLDFVEVKVELSTGIPIGATGLSLYGLGGGIYGLASSPTYFRLNADISTSDPLISKVFLLKNAELTYTVPSSFTGNGEFNLFRKYSIANAYMTLTIPSHLEIGGGVDVAGILKFDGTLGVQFPPNSSVYGNLIGELVIPDRSGFPYDIIVLAHSLPWEIARTENYLRNLSIWGFLSVDLWLTNLKLSYLLDCEPVLDGSPPKFSLGINGENLNPGLFGAAINRNKKLNELNHFEGLGLLISRTTPNKYLSLTATSSMLQTIPIKDDWSRLIFRLDGLSIIPQTILIRPDSLRFTPSDAARNSAYGIAYLENLSEHKAFWIIDNPSKGDWRIEVIDNTNPILDVFGFISPIGINVTEPSSDGSSGRIEWIDSGSPDSTLISLYYDRDNTGLDGVLIAKNIQPINGRNSYTWNYITVPPGSYYIYAVIEDGRNGTQSSYSQGKIIVSSNIPAPSNLQAMIVDSAIVLKWNRPALSSGQIQGYSIKYKEVSEANYQSSFSVRDTNDIVISSVVPGRNYQFAIASIDTNGNVSTDVQSNVVNFVSRTTNNPPIIRFKPEIASYAKVLLPYSAKIDADDADNDILLFSLLSSPAGMSFNSSTGEITWTPTLDQIGSQRISIRVSDGKGGSDSLSYTISVYEPTRPSVTFSRNVYSDSLSFAMVTISDNDANKSVNTIEEISVSFKSQSTSRTLICRETGANTGSFVGTIDLKSFSLFPRDTVRATYINLIGENVSSFAVWEAQAVVKLLTIPDSSWNFGYVKLNTLREKVIRLYNMSSFPISITSLGRSGPHSDDYTVGASGNMDISPGGFKEIFIFFRPVFSGIRTATLIIKTNYGDKILFLFGHGTPNLTFSVSGRVLAVPTDSSLSHILSGVQMTLIGQDLLLADTSNEMGNYRLLGLIDGNYEISAVKPGYFIFPHQISFSVSGLDVEGVNFNLLTEVESKEAVPKEFSLMQNYPNPFNPSTKIKFALPEQANVKLNVYNLLGEKVAELVNGELTAGYHEIEFLAKALPSGVYFYELHAGAFSKVKKMILLK
ncbi:MAG: Ig-like domain-containing protein [Proteobacteria bacterium]|nr:Ig-like domain-containing protein [Pseudomonadota bacterium]